MSYFEVEEIVRRALMEDIGTGDITTSLTIQADSMSKSRMVAKEGGVIAGLQVAAMVFEITAGAYYADHILQSRRPHEQSGPFNVKGTPVRITARRSDPTITVQTNELPQSASMRGKPELIFSPEVVDGATVVKGECIACIDGPTAVILTAERTALNLLQRMSGIATKTAHMVELVKHTEARIIDTRKTTPGLRILEKYAVRAGGGQNHRFGLYDAVLIKDNHVQACGGIRKAIRAAKNGAPHTIKIEVEADTLDQVKEALDAGADMILLDNMNPNDMRTAVTLCKGRALTEASGGITEDTIVAVAETGVDLISIGALTHSVRSLDISLDFDA
jgi:nicotinate-nucleotide pyrophosphorylase (carboxylating)